MDIEMSASMDDEFTVDVEADAQLASLYEDDDALRAIELEKVGRNSTASEKTGIKTLGGQPKVASEDGGPAVRGGGGCRSD